VGAKKKDKRLIIWISEAKENKKRLAESTLLTHPLEHTKLILKTDTSNFAIGAVLEQYQDGHWKPLRFFSKKMTNTQRRYSTYD